jgi:hypothetical protein
MAGVVLSFVFPAPANRITASEKQSPAVKKRIFAEPGMAHRMVGGQAKIQYFCISEG